MLLKDVRRLSPIERVAYWITERESIRLKKEAGKPFPLTDDAILQCYRFCNVRRMDDKVSRWLLKNWYGPYRDHPYTVVAAALARHFNLPRTLDVITPLVYRDRGPPLLTTIAQFVRRLKQTGAVFNGAYMVRGIGTSDKTEMVVEKVCRPLLDRPPSINPSSMEVSVEAMLPYWGFSSFMAGQVVADLRHAMTGSWADADDWAPLGPGSIRGLKRLYAGSVTANLGPPEVLREFLSQAIGEMQGALPLSVTKRLEAMDYQNCLCEYDKYSRVLEGEGHPKQRYPGGGS